MLRSSFLLCLLVGVLVLFWSLSRPSSFSKLEEEFPEKPTVLSHSDKGLLQNGDIFLTRGTHWRSQVVQWLHRDSEFTHAGILVEKENQWWAVHAAPEWGDENKKAPQVRMEPLSEFLANPHLQRMQVVRVQQVLPGQLKDITARALEMAEQKLPFDGKYDLSTGDSVYCTELIWRIYRAQGFDFLDSVSWERRVFLLDRPLLFPETFSSHPFTSIILDL